MNIRLLERVADTLMYVCMGIGALLFVATATGCSTLENLASTKVPVKTILVAANATDAAINVVEGYIAYCTPNPAPSGCDDAAIQNTVIPAIRAAQTARNAAEQFITDNPDATLGPSTLLDALQKAGAALSTIESQYNLKG